jgi:hypothetical protein
MRLLRAGRRSAPPLNCGVRPILMDKTTLRFVAKGFGTVVYAGAGIFMVIRVFSYFHIWNLPLWQWIGALFLAPITFVVTFVVVPVYVGLTEGDWSLVGVWVTALIVYALTAWYSHE